MPRVHVPLLGLAVLVAAALAPAGARAADAGQCRVDQARGCVMLIEVDGLEPQDVTAETTPFLWSLAHPDEAAAPVLEGRAGYIWLASRGVMTAGSAPAAASLLTGAEPSRTGIPADEYFDRGRPSGRRWLEDSSPEAAITAEDNGAMTILELVGASSTRSYATFFGNPFLARMVPPDGLGDTPPVAYWAPAGTDGTDPLLCPVPRDPQPPDPESPPPCAAADAQTLNAASQAIGALEAGPQITYIHLAEVGAVKRAAGDLDGDDEPVAKALANLDAALQSFVLSYSSSPNTADLWADTTVMVVGNHGYELTPVANRVGDPQHADDPSWDLAAFVADRSGHKAQLVPQGTAATVYWPDGSDAEVESLATAIEEQIGAACACIDEVLRMRDADALAEAHPSWSLDPVDDEGARTGTGGELLVLASPGWATGRAFSSTAFDPLASATGREQLTNPYLGSSGGPRNRAIAALVNGPETEVRQVEGSWAGVPEDPITESDRTCTDRKTNLDGTDVTGVNVLGPDDVDLPGFACQLETVDVAPTVAAFLNVGLEPAEQVSPRARLLNEAFVRELVPFREPEDFGEPEDDPEPLPQPPPIVILPPPPPPPEVPPPPPPGFDFYGLLRNLRVQVVDGKGRAWRAAAAGSAMTTLRVSGDFGRPESAVTMTLYAKDRRGRRRGRSAKLRLRAIARFKPFLVKRGPVTLKLRMPRRFRPAYVGLAVQEVADVGSQAGKEGKALGPAFAKKVLVGKTSGSVAGVRGASRLHRVKPDPRRRKRGRR